VADSESYGEHFGVSLNDQQQLIQWLQDQNFTIDEAAPARWTITFSGTAGGVEYAFHTETHLYQTPGTGRVRYANATEVQVPEAFSEVVAGVIGIQFGGQHFLSPADLAPIYNLNPLYNRGINGSGQTIGIVCRCSIDPTVVAAFRQRAGLAASPTREAPRLCRGGS
jgi:subtilase family serine protease